jgi:hypothetical protein
MSVLVSFSVPFSFLVLTLFLAVTTLVVAKRDDVGRQHLRCSGHPLALRLITVDGAPAARENVSGLSLRRLRCLPGGDRESLG